MPNRVPLQTIPKIRDWPAGVTWPSGAHLQEMVDAIRAQAGDSPDFSRRPDPRRLFRFPGYIVNKGPNKGDVDYTDERYWVQRCFIDEGADGLSTDNIDFTAEDKTIDPVGIYTVSNLQENHTSSHTLALKTIVMVEGWLDHSDPQQIRCFMSIAPNWRLSFKATTWTDSSALAGGVYQMRIRNSPTADIDKTATTSITTFGAEGAVSVVGINRREMGAATHNIDNSGTYQPLVWDGKLLTINKDGVAYFSFDGLQGRVCP